MHYCRMRVLKIHWLDGAHPTKTLRSREFSRRTLGVKVLTKGYASCSFAWTKPVMRKKVNTGRTMTLSAFYFWDLANPNVVITHHSLHSIAMAVPVIKDSRL
jgi:hypothetical protein